MIGSIALACLWISANARADLGGGTPSVLVIAAPAKAGSPDAEIIEAVRDALAEIDEVKLLPPSPLDLEAVQLALDCSDESAQCLSEIAKRMGAQIVVIPSLRQRRDALELHVTSFEHGSSDTNTAMRKQAGARLDARLLESVPSMLREVLQLRSRAAEEEAEPVEPIAPAPIEDPGPIPDEAPSEATTSFPLGPVLLGAGGIALVASGVAVGVMASSTENSYASQAIGNEAQARRADDLRVRGENEALAANILLGTGACALIAAGIWYVLDMPAEQEPQRASVRPMLAPGSAGLVLAGVWSSL